MIRIMPVFINFFLESIVSMYANILYLTSFFIFSSCGLAPTHLFVTRIGPCDDKFEGVVSISEMSVSRNVYDFIVNGYVNISEDIADGWNVKGTMEKCRDLRKVDTCDYFKTFSLIRNGCVQDDDEVDGSNIYSVFFHYTSPRITCPVKAGSYKVLNYPFFTEDNYLSVSEAKISTGVFGYTFKLKGYNEDDDMMLCAIIYLQLVYIRVHDWNSNNEELSPTATATVDSDQAQLSTEE